MASIKQAVFNDGRQDAVNVLSKRLPKLYVEGGSDELILLHFFSGIARITIPDGTGNSPGKKGGGKKRVINIVSKELDSFGFVDMDHDFKSSKLFGNKRLMDSSPEACLISHLVDKRSAMLFINQMLDEHSVHNKQDIEQIYNIAVLHSIVVWAKGRLGEDRDGNLVSISDEFWNDIFEIDIFSDYLTALDLIPILGGRHVKMYYDVNKRSIEAARYRDHSLVRTLAEYIGKTQKINIDKNEIYLKHALRRFTKKQNKSEKLREFSSVIQANNKSL